MPPDPSQHSNYITGFCGTGSHEGQLRFSPSGKELKPCTFGDRCSCSCHDLFKQMRVFIAENLPDSTKSAPVSPLPLLPPRQTTVPQKAPATVPTVPSAPLPSVPVAVGTTRRLDSGRRAKGSLDVEVADICMQWIEGKLAGDDDGNLTPKFIAGLIEASSGAISACWARWEKAGKCELARKPARFVRFIKNE